MLSETLVTTLAADAALQAIFGSGASSRIKAFNTLTEYAVTPKSAPWAFDGGIMLNSMIVRVTKERVILAVRDEVQQLQSVQQQIRITYMTDKSNTYDMLEDAAKRVYALMQFKYFDGRQMEYQEEDPSVRIKEIGNAATINDLYLAYGVKTPED